MTVWVTRSNTSSRKYHTHKCEQFPDRTRETTKTAVAGNYDKCQLCKVHDGEAEKVRKNGEEQRRECPLCGATVKRLPNHLPKCADG